MSMPLLTMAARREMAPRGLVSRFAAVLPGHLSKRSYPKGSVKWLPKSPKLHGSHSWNSQGSRWGSLKGKENIQGSVLYKFTSANEKWKEGRISPEQEAEELEDPDEDEPISKFSGSLFDSSDNIRDQMTARVALQQQRPKVALPTKAKPFPVANSKQQVPGAATSNFATEVNRFSKETKEQILGAVDASQPPLKGILITRVSKDGPVDLAGVKPEVLEDALVSEPSTPDSGPADMPSKSGPFQTVNHVITIPRIVLTRPSTSDEDTDQLTQDPDDFESEEAENVEGHLYSDCLNNAFYPP